MQFSLFYEADLLLNPALTGSTHESRAVGHSRMQWLGVQGSYNTNYLSFDTYSRKYTSGFGAYIVHDNLGKGIITTTQLNVQYSYETSISPTLAIRFGLQGGFFTKTINDNGLIYPEQVTPGGIAESNVHFGNVSYSSPDVGAGLMLHSNNFWLGVSSHHMNRPTQNFESFENRYPVKYSFISGYKITLKRTKARSGTYRGVDEYNLFPIFHYKFQGKSDQVETGLILVDNQFKIGAMYRGIPFKKYDSEIHNNEALVVLLGLRFKHFKATYSYDFVFSELTPARTRGAHELNIQYIFHKNKKPFKPSKRLPCPDFVKR